ncbi:hypothetical protein ACFVR1_16000 [Psychrobacillus sp. NPDC058041]|uniref:hypothetical protein n=1 Tax=Psychrobacillus sp. NPDC058041 TaxID=3346310 RepID=UPI0036D89A87
MNFWKYFFAGIITKIIAEMTIYKLDFFHYTLFKNFNWVSLSSFLVEIIIFAGIYSMVFYILTHFSEWKMRVKYELAQKRNNQE